MTITQNPIKNKPPGIGLDKQNRTPHYIEWRDKVAELLDEQGYHDEAERWDFCDTSPKFSLSRHTSEFPPSAERFWVCSASHLHPAVLFSPSCDFRVCPDCAPRHSARLIKRYLPVIEKELALHPEYKLRKITLTRKVQLGEEGFNEAVTDGFDLIQQLMRKVVGKEWNKKGAGLLANWEVGENGHKLHYHIIYLGNWVDWRKLKDMWRQLTGDSYIVYVQAVKRNEADWQGAVIETLKYATKFYKEDKTTGKRKYLDPELTVKLFIALKSTRRIRSYGSFYNIDPPPERVFCCEECNAKMVSIRREYWQIWSQTGFSPVEWKAMIKKSLLPFRTADKYGAITGKSDNTHPKSTRLLPGFDKIPVKEKLHYEYE